MFPPAGTYFVTADIRPLGETDGLGVLPRRSRSAAAWSRSRASVFYDDLDAGSPLVRFAFCKRLEVLDEAVARLKALTR